MEREVAAGASGGSEGGTPAGGDGGATAGATPPELAAVRELALRAHPDAVAEMVGGATLAELVASVEPARAAYRRVVEAARPSASDAASGTAAEGSRAGGGLPATVPAGAAPAFAVDPDRLPATEKIRRGLAGRPR